MLKGQDGKNSSTNYAIGTKNDKHLKRQGFFRRIFGKDFYLRPKGSEIDMSKINSLVSEDKNIGKEPGD